MTPLEHISATVSKRIGSSTHSIGTVWKGYLGWWASPVKAGERPQVFPTRHAAVAYLKEVA